MWPIVNKDTQGLQLGEESKEEKDDEDRMLWIGLYLLSIAQDQQRKCVEFFVKECHLIFAGDWSLLRWSKAGTCNTRIYDLHHCEGRMEEDTIRYSMITHMNHIWRRNSRQRRRLLQRKWSWSRYEVISTKHYATVSLLTKVVFKNIIETLLQSIIK